MFTLWVVSHVVLIVFRVSYALDFWDIDPLSAIFYSFITTTAVFAILFLTASLMGTFCGWARARTGGAIGVSAMAFAYAIGLGTLAASVLFTYPIGFSIPARLAFGAFVVFTCGLLCAGKQVAGQM